ncbi:unknown [Clostridium sp. CAG:448]|nr:unknown [Clostridium sp. CAG:448]
MPTTTALITPIVNGARCVAAPIPSPRKYISHATPGQIRREDR